VPLTVGSEIVTFTKRSTGTVMLDGDPLALLARLPGTDCAGSVLTHFVAGQSNPKSCHR
jgi:hypothetical protein